MAALTPARIGYLRSAPAFGAPEGEAPTAAAKRMWRKLAAEGYLVRAEAEGRETFVRSETGQKAVDRFDETLSEECRAILNAVRAGKRSVPTMKGIYTVLDAGLVSFVADGLTYALTPDGERLADPVGEVGYFRKSGSLVRVLSVCTESSYEGELHVERVDTGKQMVIPRRGFVRMAEWEAEHEA